MLGLLWLLAGSFLLGAIVSLAIAAYVGVHLLSRAEESQIRSRHAYPPPNLRPHVAGLHGAFFFQSFFAIQIINKIIVF